MPALDVTSALRRFLPAPLAPIAATALGWRELARLHSSLQPSSDFASSALTRLAVSIHTSPRDLQHIPASGPVLLTCNHPHGLVDGLALLHTLRAIRPDVRILANHLLTAIPELHDFLIPVDPLHTAPHDNHTGLRRALAHLHNGGLLVVFPAGEVSHLHLSHRAITDPPWSPTIARLATLAARRLPQLKLVPAFLSGRNSWLFQLAGLAHPRLRTALLAHELLNKQRTTIHLRLGSPVPASKLSTLDDDSARTAYLRSRTDLLATRPHFQPQTRRPLLARLTQRPPAPIAPPVDPDALARDIAALQPTISSGPYAAYIARAHQLPNVLPEIARLREITFRAAGEGTGKSADSDRFDSHYWHLFLWNPATREIIGAYRLAETSQTPLHNLYTSTLFRYGQPFLDTIGPALELGRSWIRPEYQKTFTPLLLLWKAIGRFVAAHPEAKILYGPVSISNDYPAIARDLIVAFLQRFAALPAWQPLVQSTQPYALSHPHAAQHFLTAHPNLDDLAQAVTDIEPAREGVPVLLRQYLKLGGKLLAFNVDPDFASALDGLIVVDLTQTEPRLLARYLGATEAHQFLNFHRSI